MGPELVRENRTRACQAKWDQSLSGKMGPAIVMQNRTRACHSKMGPELVRQNGMRACQAKRYIYLCELSWLTSSRTVRGSIIIDHRGTLQMGTGFIFSSFQIVSPTIVVNLVVNMDYISELTIRSVYAYCFV